jgi:NADPH:quinone reductase-like Zn-dependent oxidoreductase
VQLAVARGAKVFATVAAQDFDLVRSWGAMPIDFRSETVADDLGRHTGGEGFDIVFDAVGGTVLDASFTVARRYGGHVVSILGWGTHSLAPLSFRAATYSGVFTLLPLLTGDGRDRHGDILRETAALVDSGRMQPRVDERRFTLATANQAHALVAAGQGRGKVVVEI